MFESFALSLFLSGITASLAGFIGFLYPITSIILLVPIYYLYKYLSNISKSHILFWILVIIWISHFIQVLVPETGFDALWYHLPIAKNFADSHQILYLKNYYQSLNPLFPDMIFTLGFMIAGSFGTKLIAFLFGLAIVATSREIAKKYLSNFWLLLFLILISTFQVITWQSASFYTDLAKSFFELASIYYLIKFSSTQNDRHVLLSGLFFSGSLASKQFSILLLPVMLILVWILSKRNSIKQVVAFFLSSLIVSLPFYVRPLLISKNPFLSLSIHLRKLNEIGGYSNIYLYLQSRFSTLHSSFYKIFLNRDYISFVIPVFLPLLILQKSILKKKTLLTLLIFSINSWLIWWLVPPLSSRYAISGFITVTLLIFIAIEELLITHPQYKNTIVLIVSLGIIFGITPRVTVNLRSLKYILGDQTKQKYLDQFMDGNINKHLRSWYQEELKF